MAGKSTYLKQAALLAIIAQIGCFIPANYATMPSIRFDSKDSKTMEKFQFSLESSQEWDTMMS